MKILRTKEDLKQIKYGDYLSGTEMYGVHTRKSRGLFHEESVREGREYVEVQMDDGYPGNFGYRGNHLNIDLGEITILEPGDEGYNTEFVKVNLIEKNKRY